MIWIKIVVVVAMLAVFQVSADYRTSELSDENEREEEDKTENKYSGSYRRRTTSIQPSEKSSGLDDSSGFMDFFQGAPIVFSGMPRRTYQGARPPSSVVTSKLGQDFPIIDSGFVANSPSFFGASSSASETDFMFHNHPSNMRSYTPLSEEFFSPSFAMLKQDVDREIGYQGKGGSVEDKKATHRVKSSGEDSKSVELDGFDFSKLNVDDSSEQGSTEQSSEERQSSENERNDSAENTSIESTKETPYRVVNHYHQRASLPQTPSEKTLKETPLPRPLSQGHAFNPQDKPISPSPSKRTPGHYESVPRYYRNEKAPRNTVASTHSNLYYRPLAYTPPTNLNGYTPTYHTLVRNAQSTPLYKPVRPKLGGIPHKSRNLNLHYRPKPIFKPSPKDVFLDYSQNSPLKRRRAYTISEQQRRGGLRSSQEKERETGVLKKVKSPAVSAHKQKNFCKKSRKKINSREFPRFEPQQMICYTCLDKVKNSTYEECRYEPEPEDKSFFEKVAESRSFKTLLSSPSGHGRHERSIGKSNEKARTSSSKHVLLVKRSKREYMFDDFGDSEEQNEDDDDDEDSLENYLDESSSPEHRDEWKIGNLPTSDEYSFVEDESEEFSDIEAEFRPPKTSRDGNCNQVFKKGLTCLVCKDSKTGSSSEQCSSFSDPADNKYEYSSQSSYGSRRNPSRDRKKRFNNNRDNKAPRPGKQQPHLTYLKGKNKRNSDVKAGPLKLNNEPSNNYYGRTSLEPSEGGGIQDKSSFSRTPDAVEPSSSFYSSQEQLDDSKDNNKRRHQTKRTNYVGAEKRDNPTINDETEKSEDPVYNPSKFPEVNMKNSYTGEILKLKPNIGEAPKNEETRTKLDTKYLDSPTTIGGGI